MSELEGHVSKLQGLRVLVVEDDATLLKIVSTVLTNKAAKVFTALNGSEAMSVLASQTIDLIVTDIQMPVMTGIELLAEVQRFETNRPTVLFLTGQASVSEAESLRLGAAGLLHKPVRSKVLIEKIESLL